MILARSPSMMRNLARRWRSKNLTIGLVPTMGALHAGHASLIRRARRECDRVAVSIFVNPAQFGPNEDFARYPRSLPQDRRLCASCGADAVYHPGTQDVYPAGYRTFVEVEGLSSLLCGRFRPGHFRGVATVVLKLFQTVVPHRAYFGEKDFQQLAIIKRMSSDLHLPVKIVGCPTIREKDGLALSSRNAYLSPEERAQARRLYAGLSRGVERAAAAGAKPESVTQAVRSEILAIPGVSIDYVSLVDENTLEDAPRLSGRLRLLAAIRLGKTRLIDNVPVIC
ncbi:MAG: pantoate--beta-alanine ligase [Elusimicrobia bacterium]|nr:pantoate--beta-alanine ligase [Elusimicrobiota bacterium]